MRIAQNQTGVELWFYHWQLKVLEVTEHFLATQHRAMLGPPSAGFKNTLVTSLPSLSWALTRSLTMHVRSKIVLPGSIGTA
jgi:hypothetical protein